MIAADIRACFREYYQYRFNEVGLFEFEISGVNYPKEPCRFDAFMITPHRQVMKGFEFKVSRSDFLADQKIRPKKFYWGQEAGGGEAKWRAYIKYCNLFFFVCPEGLIKPEEVEAPAGLIWIVGEPPPPPHHLKSFYFDLKKRPKRTMPTGGMDLALQRRILFLFAARAKTRNGSYF